MWYTMTMHFGLQGYEVLVQLNKSDLKFKEDDSGEFVELSTDFASKNCPGGTAGREFATVGRVNDVQQVAAIRLFLQSFIRPSTAYFSVSSARAGEVKAGDKTWFNRQALGHNLLGGMMQRISERAGLSRKYTNHCVRATTVTLLKERGIEDRKVCLVTGHKAERSLQHYDKPGNAECNDLARLLDGKDPKAAVAVALSKEFGAAGSSLSGFPNARNDFSRNESGDGFTLHAQGATINNLTINYHQAWKRKFNLSRREMKRPNGEAAAELSMTTSKKKE